MEIKPNPDVRFTNNADGAVLLNLKTGVVFKMNPIGAQIWTLIEQRLPLDQILLTLAGTYNVPSAQIEEDARKFLHQLKNKGLIQSDQLG